MTEMLQLSQFVPIPARPFLMGSRPEELSELARAYGGTRESYREESPRHLVGLAAVAIARGPLSNRIYAAFVAAAGARPPLPWRGPQPPAERLDHPVVDVSWHEALACCAWLSEQIRSGRLARPDLTSGPDRAYNHAPQLRLPSEAEWEHAARGEDGRRFPWGEQFGPGLANTREAGLAATTPPGLFAAGASPYGVDDMAGNVWEWTSTLDRPYPYRADDGREDLAAAGRRILRGGCYANPHGFARCACRFRLPPAAHNEFTGFRLAFSL